MTKVWSYPWRLLAPDGRSLADLRERGIEGVSVASHYHSTRSLTATADAPQFHTFPRGRFFDPGEYPTDPALDPPVHSVSARAQVRGRGFSTAGLPGRPDSRVVSSLRLHTRPPDRVSHYDSSEQSIVHRFILSLLSG